MSEEENEKRREGNGPAFASQLLVFWHGDEDGKDGDHLQHGRRVVRRQRLGHHAKALLDSEETPNTGQIVQISSQTLDQLQLGQLQFGRRLLRLPILRSEVPRSLSKHDRFPFVRRTQHT